MKRFKKIYSQLFSNYKNIYIFIGSFVVIAMFLQWAINYQTFWAVISNQGLGFWQKIQTIFKAFVNLFRLINDFTPISILLISLAQSLSLTMLIDMKNSRAGKAFFGASFLSIIGVGCTACSGSLLGAVVSALAVNVSITLVDFLGNLVLFVAIIMSYNLLFKVVRQYEQFI